MLKLLLFIVTKMRYALQKSAWKLLQKKGLVTVGRHTYGVPKVYFWNFETKLCIGNFCSIAEGVVIILGGEHRADWKTTFPFSVFLSDWPSAAGISGHPSTKGDIAIGSDVWIGHGALILSGVTIGNGAVIGAGSVVSKDVPPFTIVGGNPARVIRARFDSETIKAMEREKWWEWPDETVNQRVSLLMSKPNFS